MLKRIIDFILWLFGIKDDEDVEKATTDIKYEKKTIMSDYEIMFYNRMKDLETEYNIVPQLVLSSVVDKKSKQKYRSELYRIIDFAIFSKDYSKLLLLIELNDNTHNQRKRKDRDLKVKKRCNSAKIKLITFYTKYPNEKDYIINRIKKEIETNESMNKENDII